MKIEIMHTRDPDGGCDHRVLVDGVASTDYAIETIDPGRGYMLSDWDEYTETVRAADHSPEFKAMVLAERDEARESKYVEDDS